MLPRFVRGPVSACLWLVLGCLIAGASAAWLAKVPVYATGQAVVFDGGPVTVQTAGGEFVVVVCLPTELLRCLRVGSLLLLRTGPQDERTQLIVVQLKETIAGAEVLQQRLGLTPAVVGATTMPGTIATARVKPIAGKQQAMPAAGSLLPVEVEVGSRRMISLLPAVGPLFRGTAHGNP